MKKHKHITTLFLDIGGVLLTNGWDRNMRKKAAEHFHLDYDELDERHNMTFDTYEEGKLSIDEYLKLVVFHKKRPFEFNAFKEFLFSQTQPLPDMIKMFKSISESNALKVGAISNEGRELTIYRVSRFGLKEFIQFFICSCFVHFRKPDKDIYKIALDVGQVTPEQSVYIDDRKLHVEVASSLGMNAIHHIDIDTTRHKLSEYGLTE
jgi:putative hydrolase of the HAD superfamily